MAKRAREDDDEFECDEPSDGYDSKRARTDYSAGSVSFVWFRYNGHVVINTPATGYTEFDSAGGYDALPMVTYVAGDVITARAGGNRWVSCDMAKGRTVDYAANTDGGNEAVAILPHGTRVCRTECVTAWGTTVPVTEHAQVVEDGADHLVIADAIGAIVTIHWLGSPTRLAHFMPDTSVRACTEWRAQFELVAPVQAIALSACGIRIRAKLYGTSDVLVDTKSGLVFSDEDMPCWLTDAHHVMINGTVREVSEPLRWLTKYGPGMYIGASAEDAIMTIMPDNPPPAEAVADHMIQ